MWKCQFFCLMNPRDCILFSLCPIFQEDKYCEAILRPKTSRTCVNKRCKAVWKAGKWSEVSKLFVVVPPTVYANYLNKFPVFFELRPRQEDPQPDLRLEAHFRPRRGRKLQRSQEAKREPEVPKKGEMSKDEDNHHDQDYDDK